MLPRRSPSTIDSHAFYRTYHGHEPSYLRHVLQHVAGRAAVAGDDLTAAGSAASSVAHQRPVVFLAGDSSMDNKFWLTSKAPAVNGYESILSPPLSVPDIAHHLNVLYGRDTSRTGFVAVNTAVEESTLGMRIGDGSINADPARLLPQDELIRDEIRPLDVLVVSVGGNDIALKPTSATIVAMGWLSWFASPKNIAKGTAWGLGHFRQLMHHGLETYLEQLTSRQKPALIVPMMIYYPDEDANAQSWAKPVLAAIGYNRKPAHLQGIINAVFTHAMSKVTVEGTVVAPLALSAALDGKDTRDYVARVEPSERGGAKIASLIRDHIARFLPTSASGSAHASPTPAVAAAVEL